VSRSGKHRLPLAALVGALGCYTYQPLAEPPAPGTSVGLTLSDRGRAELRPVVGSEVMRVDGTVVDVTDSAYRLAINESVGLRGARQTWNGETVDFRRDYVQQVAHRQISRPRTFFAILAGAVAVTALITSQNLFGLGGSGNDAPPGGGNEQ
jgi:hypothetical protein